MVRNEEEKMHWQSTPYTLPLLIATAISAAIAIYAWRRRSASGAIPLVLLMLAVAEWSLGYTLELGSADLPAKIFWARVQYLGIVTVPTVWLAFVLQYIGREKWLARRNVVMLVIEPFVILLLIWTNDVHYLFYSSIRLDTSGSFSVLDLTYGAWFWVNAAYSYLLLLLGTFLLIQALMRSPHLYRGQAGALLVGALAPWIGNVLYVSGLSPFPHLDLTPFAFTLTGLVMAWGVFHFRLLDIVPVARDAVIENMSDVVIVLDAQNRIVDLNPAAQQAIGRAAAEIIGQPAPQVLSDWPDLVERYRGVTEAHSETVLREGEAQRAFDLRISPLRNQQGRLIGRLVVLRDITERRQAEEALRRAYDELEMRVQERTAELAKANEALQVEVTERVQAEEALRESEEKFRSLAEQSPNMIFINKKGKIVYANEKCEETMGYTREEFYSPDFGFLTLIAPDSMDLVKASFSRHMKGGGIPSYEYALITKEGKRIEAIIATKLMKYGGESAILGIITDITERKRAEEALRQRTEEISLLYEAGRQFSRTLDLEVVYDTLYDLVSSIIDCDGLFVSSYDSKDSLIRCTYARHERQRLDASQFPPIPLGPKGHETQSVAVWTGEPLLIQDCQAQSKACQPVYYTGKGRFADGGKIPDEADRTRSAIIVPLKLEGRMVGLVQVSSYEYDAYTEDDLRFLEALALQVAAASNNALLYQQAQGEIAERQRAEAALEEERALLARRVAERTADLSAANAELARAARLKDEFLASMSHELRTPLNAVLGLSEALQEEVYGPLSERQHKSLRTIEESGRHLLALINDILDVSKVEAGKLELEIGPVSVESVCQASLGLIKQAAHKKRLKVSSSFDSAVEILQADQRRLKQILVNLLSNAVKFTPEGGEVGLEVVGDAEREVAHFTVWDTGIGILSEEMGRLFQPFVQLDSSLSRQYTGTGLGLALVRRLTELHGGGVSVGSEVGQGSRFTVSLPWQGPVLSRARPEPGRRVEGSAGTVEPVAEPEPVEAGTSLAGAAAQRPAVERPLILLAEDNEDSIATFSDYLLAKGYRVVVARDGAEAIERVREERPELILMDIQMPGMDGLEATRHIRADAAQSVATVPIIALTALAMPGDRERCLEAGADEYLSKPVSLRELVRAIEVQLRKAESERQ
jgi:PAS domain S-box-containing protein